jgi:hypothetical protein
MVENYLRKPVQKGTNRVADTNPRTGKHIITFRNSTNYLHAKPKMRRVSKPNAHKPKIDKARNLGKKTQIPPCNDDTAAAAPESSSSVRG